MRHRFNENVTHISLKLLAITTQGEGDDDEPSLGSFDRMADQSKAWTSRDPMAAIGDNEQDDCDHEDSDPAEESEASGVGDQDGLDEQVPFRDWQMVGMV
jgi:hypothetical protein